MARRRQTKYIVITGGVLSGSGKGITAASLGAVLKARGYDISIMKCDLYLNTDAGTLNPAEHGEVFVTADGGETDLDLGHYERFLDKSLSKQSSLMNGALYAELLANERSGKYLGKTVQIIPHLTDLIQDKIIAAGEGSDIHIVELGGTVGDYEGLAHLDAIRQLRYRVGVENVVCGHVAYLPYLAASKELKTKPAQNSLRDINAAGIPNDVIFARADYPISDHIINKISLFSNLPTDAIVPLPTARSVYEVPLTVERSGIADYICKQLALPKRKPELAGWDKLARTIAKPDKPELNIGVVAKYLTHEDTYMSVFEAIKAAAWAHKQRPVIKWIDAEQIEKDGAAKHLQGLDGIVVPGGFGSRGVEGKIAAAAWARDNRVPYLGLCLGMQVAVIAVARQALGKGAHTTEVVPNAKHPVISLMDEQHQVVDKGGTMRLGDYACKLAAGSKARKAYGAGEITERHRHRWEVNNDYRQQLEAAGLQISGTSPDGQLVEVVELKDHPFFVASQFHPEFTSRPLRPNPLFAAFVGEAKH